MIMICFLEFRFDSRHVCTHVGRLRVDGVFVCFYSCVCVGVCVCVCVGVCVCVCVGGRGSDFNGNYMF